MGTERAYSGGFGEGCTFRGYFAMFLKLWLEDYAFELLFVGLPLVPRGRENLVKSSFMISFSKFFISCLFCNFCWFMMPLPSR